MALEPLTVVSCKQGGGEEPLALHPSPRAAVPSRLCPWFLHPKRLPGSHSPCQQRSSCSCSTPGAPGAKTNKQEPRCSGPIYLKYSPDYLLEILPPQSSHCVCQENSLNSRAFLHQCPLSFRTRGRNTGRDSGLQLQLFPVGNSFSGRGTVVLCAPLAPFSPH